MRFEVRGSSSVVVAWSENRLQFEPGASQRPYRDQLRQQLKALRPRAGQALLAEYRAPDEDFADVENVLLYNVGSSAFTSLGMTGVTCRRGPSSDDFHRVRYELVDEAPAPGRGLVAAQVEAELEVLPRKTGQWWAALRPAAQAVDIALRERQFSLDVTLSGPRAARPGLTTLTKPLLDGLVSCFHAHDGSHEAAIYERAPQLGLPGDTWPLLVDTATNVLGTRPLLRPWGTTLAWNPADDLCAGFRVRVQDAPRWSVTALLRAEPSAQGSGSRP